MGLRRPDDQHAVALDQTPQENSTEPLKPSELPEDFSPFFYLLDVLTAANTASMGLSLVQRLLSVAELPFQIQETLSLVPETEQLIVMIPDFLEKLEIVKATVEGALQVAAASELANQAAELMSGNDGRV